MLALKDSVSGDATGAAGLIGYVIVCGEWDPLLEPGGAIGT